MKPAHQGKFMRHHQQPNAFTYAWLIASLTVMLVFNPGCKSPGRTIHATATATVEAVDLYMADYSQRVSTGQVGIEQEAKVKAAWEKYQKASLASEAIIKLYIGASKSDSPDIKGKMSDAVKQLDTMRTELITLLKGIL